MRRTPTLPPTLTYCTNLLPSESLAEVRAGLERVFVPLRKRLGKEQLPVGLYLSSRATEELQLPEVLDACTGTLSPKMRTTFSPFTS